MKLFKNLKSDGLFTNGKLIIIAIVAAVVFVVSLIAGMNSKVTIRLVVNNDAPRQVETTVQSGENEITTNAPIVNETVTGAPVENETVADTGVSVENTTAAVQQSTPASGTAITAKEDIIALYNGAVNKVKTEATKITRNFRNVRYDAEKSVLPSAVAKMGNPMMEKYVKDDTEPVEYLTKEEMIENFPVPKQEYSSKLTAADVVNATCVDNGTEYEITLYLADSKNPTAGVGVGAGCHFMDTTSITSSEAAATMIKKFDAIYENCVIKCKIDKATNRVTWANYYTPFTIDAVMTIIVELSTTVVMSYERDYTITY